VAVAPLITAADLPDSDEADDAAVEATAVVRNYCHWHVAPSITETVTLNGGPSAVLELPSLHVTAVGAVLVDGVAITFDYEWLPCGLLRAYPWAWGSTWRSVQVTFTHGLPDVPDDVRVAAKSVARRRLVNPRGLRSESMPGYSRVFAVPATGELGSALSDVEREILGPYRLGGGP